MLLSSTGVGDARLVQHASGTWTAVWSERAGNDWHIMLANSYDGGATWSTSMQVVAGIKAPLAQESAVQVAAAALPRDQLALAFTGWAVQPYSQIWAKQVDAFSGAGSNLALLPDAGDMVYSPSVAVQADGRWEVVWQQKTGIDMEVYLAERSAAGVWSSAVNVSSDPLHLNYDAHLATGAQAQLHLMTPHAVPADAKWMKWNLAGSWQDSGVPVWRDSDGTGLHIVLTDGGLGDEDGTLNGEIADPGMLAAPNNVNASVPAAAAGGGGGCLISVDHPLSVSLMLLWMAGLLGLACRQRG